MFKKIIYIFLLSLILSNANALENAFYILRDGLPDNINNQKSSDYLASHAKAINVLITQAYQIDKNGMIWGDVDPQIINYAKQNNIKLMLMVTNQDFDRKVIHDFLSNKQAKDRAISYLVDACKRAQCYGVQFDFEGIFIDDKNALTEFYKQASKALHEQGLKVSFTIFPIVTNKPDTTEFLRVRHEYWSGAYDYKALGKLADFVTLMAYDQHGDGTVPGPVAALPWVDAIVKYALEYMPAKKISLGIPVYSDHWYTGPRYGRSGITSIGPITEQISYAQTQEIMNKTNATFLWDNNDSVPFALFTRNWLNEIIFAENADSFQAKLALAKKYNLHGISVWRLGMEDPKVWNVLQ